MSLLWAAISAHGFGHAAQVVPVLNALGRLVPNLRVLLRTMVPAWFFEQHLTVPWELSAAQQDVGCIQNGPLTIDIEATWREHNRFHLTWDDRIHMEVEAMRAARPNMILADTPYVAVAAGAQAAIPTVALVSFTWDLILSEYPAPPDIAGWTLLQSIRQAYAKADLALRITPAPKMELFPSLIDIGSIAEPATSSRERLAALVRLAPGERTILVGFGGIPQTSLPFAQLEPLTGYRFLFDGPIPSDSTRFISTQSLPLSFKTLLASVDIILTKPGYGTLVEAIALGIPLVYVRRYNFADEQSLVDYLHQHGRGVELTREDFVRGRWEPAIRSALNLPMPTTPAAVTGAEEAASHLARFF